jgi:predicted acylesterase/phospholipase RssA
MSRQEIPLGVSLSGGGFRGTLFSLGVLYYLVDSGLARSLRSVVSVSGGSVANAFVAQECDLATVTSGELESIVRRMARRIGTTGLLRTGPAILWLLGLGLALIATLAGLILLPTTLLRLAALAAGITVLGLLLHLRGFALGHAMRRAFFSRGGRPTRLRDLARPGVRHALVATEMTSGRPVFFEPHLAHGPGLRRCYGECGLLPVHLAVGWSCAVPELLPPGRFRPGACACSPPSMVRRRAHRRRSSSWTAASATISERTTSAR